MNIDKPLDEMVSAARKSRNSNRAPRRGAAAAGGVAAPRVPAGPGAGARARYSGAAPAQNAAPAAGLLGVVGDKIIVSNLPDDVKEADVTVSPAPAPPPAPRTASQSAARTVAHSVWHCRDYSLELSVRFETFHSPTTLVESRLESRRSNSSRLLMLRKLTSSTTAELSTRVGCFLFLFDSVILAYQLPHDVVQRGRVIRQYGGGGIESHRSNSFSDSFSSHRRRNETGVGRLGTRYVGSSVLAGRARWGGSNVGRVGTMRGGWILDAW